MVSPPRIEDVPGLGRVRLERPLFGGVTPPKLIRRHFGRRGLDLAFVSALERRPLIGE